MTSTPRKTIGYTSAYLVPNSRAVRSLHYNEKAQELHVYLKSNEAVYTYSNVDVDTYLKVRDADSVGRAYTRLKKSHGPGVSQGHAKNIVPKRTETPREKQPWERERLPNGRFKSSGTGTPKAMTYATGAVVTDNTSSGTITAQSISPSTFITLGSSSISVTGSSQRKHEVFFTKANGTEGSYNLPARDVDDAVSQVGKVAETLGVTLKVRKVTVHFA